MRGKPRSNRGGGLSKRDAEARLADVRRVREGALAALHDRLAAIEVLAGPMQGIAGGATAQAVRLLESAREDRGWGRRVAVSGRRIRDLGKKGFLPLPEVEQLNLLRDQAHQLVEDEGRLEGELQDIQAQLGRLPDLLSVVEVDERDFFRRLILASPQMARSILDTRELADQRARAARGAHREALRVRLQVHRRWTDRVLATQGVGTIASVIDMARKAQELGQEFLEKGEEATSGDLETAHNGLDDGMRWAATQSWMTIEPALRRACKPGWERAKRSLRRRESQHPGSPGVRDAEMALGLLRDGRRKRPSGSLLPMLDLLLRLREGLVGRTP